MGTVTKDSAQAKRRQRWVSAVWALFLLGVLVVPEVNTSIAQYDELKALRFQRANQADWPARVRLLGERVELVREETVDLESTLVSADEMSKFTEEIARMARVQCQLRSIRPGPVSQQRLEELLEVPSTLGVTGGATPTWVVRSRASLVSIRGSFADLLGFISMLDDDPRILQLELLDLEPLQSGAEELVLDLRIKTFDLKRGDSA